ncbi:MAG: hypothetical protein MJZ76_05170 [Bacteroidales bacterium]|nr:hypothetical protein [Bacteroidales bacterium]
MMYTLNFPNGNSQTYSSVSDLMNAARTRLVWENISETVVLIPLPVEGVPVGRGRNR